MRIRIILPILFVLSSLACGEETHDTPGLGGAGGAAGQLAGGTGGGGEGGAAGTAGAGGAAGSMSTGGVGGSTGGAGGMAGAGGGMAGSGGTAGNGGAGGEIEAGIGGAGGESGLGGAGGMGSLQEDLGPCCETHESAGCQDQATAECVCAMIPSCCTDSWDEACALMVTQKHCEPGVRACVCGSGPDEWQLQSQCCMGDWPALCQSTAVQKCGARDSCF